MNKHLLLAAVCTVTLAACFGGGAEPAKDPKFSEGRSTMAKIGGRPLPVFEFSAKIDAQGNKITGARAYVSITDAQYKRAGETYELVQPQTLEAEFIANVSQVRATVDPAKEEALAAYLNGENSTVAFQIEVDWQSPDGKTSSSTRSYIFTTDHETISTAGLAKEIK